IASLSMAMGLSDKT
ncbi:glycosyl transferases group 1 family protein, partial [Vibrio parahaemolyticus V-223/04]